MNTINDYVSDVFQRLMKESAKLMRYSGRTTMSVADVETATKLNLPPTGQMVKIAVDGAKVCVESYAKSFEKDDEKEDTKDDIKIEVKIE